MGNIVIISSRTQSRRRLREEHYELISLVIVESGEREVGSGGSKTGESSNLAQHFNNFFEELNS